MRRALSLPSINKPRKQRFRTPENKKIRKLFSLLTPFGKSGTVLNERKQKKSPESRLHAAASPQCIRFSELSCIFSYRPPGPQFRENSRERAARSLGIESQRFDPPSLGGHRLFRRKAERERRLYHWERTYAIDKTLAGCLLLISSPEQTSRLSSSPIPYIIYAVGSIKNEKRISHARLYIQRKREI